jgi:hypothetical protein
MNVSMQAKLFFLGIMAVLASIIFTSINYQNAWADTIFCSPNVGECTGTNENDIIIGHTGFIQGLAGDNKILDKRANGIGGSSGDDVIIGGKLGNAIGGGIGARFQVETEVILFFIIKI